MLTPLGELPDRLARGMSLAEQHEWLTRPVSRRGLLAAGLAGLGVGATAPLLAPLAARAAADPSLVGRQLVHGADPTTQMTVGFAVDAAIRTASATASAPDGRRLQVPATVAGTPGTGVRYARASWHGLTPGTSYRYAVAADGRTLATGRFTTAADGPHRFRFTAFGDQALGADAAAVLAQVGRAAPALHLFAGDLAYADESGRGGPGDVLKPAKWDRWIRQNDPVASAVPWMCVPGNHEMEPGAAMHGYAGMLTRVPIGGASPPAVPVACAFQVGTVGFVGLDSNDVSYEIPANRGWTHSAQTAWLERTLAAWRAPGSGVDHVVAFCHASAYTTNRGHANEGGIRDAWVPLFDRYSVDLVVSGHNHCYERTLPIRAGRPVGTDTGQVDSSQGTTYVVAGGGGASLGDYSFDPTPRVVVKTADGSAHETALWRIPSERRSSHCVVVVDVVPADTVGGTTSLVLRTVDPSGLTIDRVTLSRRATGSPTGSGGGVPLWSTAAVVGAAGTAAAVGAAVLGGRRGRQDLAAGPEA